MCAILYIDSLGNKTPAWAQNSLYCTLSNAYRCALARIGTPLSIYKANVSRIVVHQPYVCRVDTRWQNECEAWQQSTRGACSDQSKLASISSNLCNMCCDVFDIGNRVTPIMGEVSSCWWPFWLDCRCTLRALLSLTDIGTCWPLYHDKCAHVWCVVVLVGRP